ncbi:MAG: RNA methyltransferase [Lachnospiraceae bacterium]|nr:RNA methyltransferase [Lachnospiraceae bacterium]
MILSVKNPKYRLVKDLLNRAKVRREQKAFIIEGLRSFQEAPKEDIVEVFISAQFQKEHPEIEGEVVNNNLFQSLSDVKTPQGILAIVRQKSYTLEYILESGRKFFLILDGVQDPGNMGTIIRTCEGAGVSGIILDRSSADIYAPKVVRSTMGSIFRVPFFYTEDLCAAVLKMKGMGIGVYGAVSDSASFYHEIEYAKNAAFLIGSEGRGLREELKELADMGVAIPMGGKLESLNAAISAALLLYRYRTQQL